MPSGHRCPIGGATVGYGHGMSFAPLDVLARTAGGALAAGAGVLGAARQRVKPLHPEGELRHATITRMSGPIPSGVPWLDSAGQDDVVVRISRAVGLPDALPDIHGLAIRLVVDGTEADLLFANTGTGRLTRYVLTAAHRPTNRPMTTLLPYRSPRGPLLLAAVPESEHAFELCWAGPVGPWHPFGRLELGASYGQDLPMSFDPILHVLPGLGHYSWVTLLREPAYWTARSRSGRVVHPTRAAETSPGEAGREVPHASA